MKKIAIALLLLVLGCTTGEMMPSLHEGMSRSQVEEKLGRPDGFMRSSDQVAYQYVNKLTSGWSYDRADYYVIFEDDRLVQWGAGEVRPAQDTTFGTFVVIPFR
jgi:outer membrane protein assembly factor BamE (lipoprotein component of BamABCDE complex)